MPKRDMSFYKYLIKNWKNLDLVLTEHPWPDLYEGFKCYDYSISLTWQEKTTVGRGTARNSFLALMKAAGEAVERWCQEYYSWPSSSGLSVHPNLKKAIQNSQHELIERDAFHQHYLLSLPFLKTKETQDYLKLRSSLQENLAFLGVDFFLVELNSAIKKNKTVLVGAVGSNAQPAFGLVLGLASSLSFKIAAEKAICECLRNLSPFLFNKLQRNILMPSFAEKKFWKGKINHLCAQQKGYGRYFKNIFFTGQNNFSSPSHPNLKKEIYFDSVSYEIPLPFSCPLKLVRTQSVELQKHYNGTINTKRTLSPSFNISLEKSFVSLNQVCHPLS